MLGRLTMAMGFLVTVGGCLSSPAPRALPDDWLRVEGGEIIGPGGTPFHGRGAMIPDTRGCDSCTWNAPVPAEVERRIDLLVDGWGANLVRVGMESYAEANGRVNYQSVLEDQLYLSDLERIVTHVANKPGAYAILTLWIDPSLTADHWPTTQSAQVWSLLAETLADQGHVVFEIAESPASATDGSQDAALWQALDDTVAAIRTAEQAAGTPPHLILVPSLTGGSRLDYYVDHPIEAGDGRNIAYAVGGWVAQSGFADSFLTPAETLPVVVVEFGPTDPMTLSDADALMVAAEAAEVPWVAWIFHQRCSPDLLVDNSGGSCGVDMTLAPTEWGEHVRDRLAQPW